MGIVKACGVFHSTIQFSSSLAFRMNATIFEMDYWYFITKKMHLDWQLMVCEMLMLFTFCILAIAYAWGIEIEANKVQVKNQKNDRKLRIV